MNEALQKIGDNQALVTGTAPNFDTSAGGIAASQLYAPTVAAVGRQWGWDFARKVFALVATANTPPVGWAFEYAYPPNGIELWQLQPAAITDANNPLPVNWDVGNVLVAAVQTKVVWTNLANAVAVYNNNPSESTWDSLFREAVVDMLSRGLAMALAGRPETAAAMLESGQGFVGVGQGRPD